MAAILKRKNTRIYIKPEKTVGNSSKKRGNNQILKIIEGRAWFAVHTSHNFTFATFFLVFSEPSYA